MSTLRTRYRFSKSIEKQLTDLQKLDNWHALIAVSYDYGIITLAILIGYLEPTLYIVSLVLIGSRQRAFATLLHEATHCCLTKNRRLSYFIGTYLSGYLIFQE